MIVFNFKNNINVEISYFVDVNFIKSFNLNDKSNFVNIIAFVDIIFFILFGIFFGIF